MASIVLSLRMGDRKEKDKALKAILILMSDAEKTVEIAEADADPVLVDLLRTGTKSQTCEAAVVLSTCVEPVCC